MSITVLFAGVFAISESAQQSEQTAMDAGGASSSAYNTSTEVFGNVVSGGGIGVVWFGIAAIIVVALGVLVAGGRGGR